jgi:hypothetical protein
MLRMVRTAFFGLVALAALLVPGGFIVLVAWKLLKRLQLRPEVALPVHGPSGAILYARDDWERQMAATRPVRWAITRLLDYPRRRRLAKLPKMTHQEVILTWPFRALASWVEKNHEKVWGRPKDPIDPLFEAQWDAMEEVKALYIWWISRESRAKELDKADPSMREYLIEAKREEDQLMLARLVNVRIHLS